MRADCARSRNKLFDRKLDWKKHKIGDDLSKRELDTGKTAYRWSDAWSGKTGDTGKFLVLDIASHSVAMLHLKAK